MNPILPEKYFIPDVEARVMPDGRLYLYGSWGDWATQIFDTHELHCLSTDDLVHWEDHGLIYRNDETWAGLPLGPYRKCGVIVDNVYCDPQTWNDHGSIEEFNGQWYVFYHKASQNSFTWRRVSIEPIEFDENGLIKEVEMTSQGAFGPLDAFSTIPARTACRIMGTSYIGFAEGREVLTSVAGKHWKVNDWAEYKYIDFGADTPRNFRMNVRGKGTLTLKADGNETICTAEFDNAAFADVTVPVTAEVTGIHKLWLFMDGDFEVMEFVFEK